MKASGLGGFALLAAFVLSFLRRLAIIRNVTLTGSGTGVAVVPI